MKINRNPIIVALDVSTPNQAFTLADQLKDVVGGFKIGSQLFTIGGPALVRGIAKKGPVFLDLKFHDIPNTVAKAVTAAALLGVRMVNIHCLGGLEMMQAAEQAARIAGMELGATPLVLGVTVLTSMEEDSMHDIGIPGTVAEQVERLVRLGMEARLRGYVCSGKEVSAVRAIVLDGFELVVPGIRLPGAETQDQKRTGTPKQAMDDGATWLVIGRPIYEAKNPRQAAEEILASLN